MRRIRSKYNTTLIHTKEAITNIIENKNNGIKSLIAFLSDQSPKRSSKSYWTNFMNIKVPCFTGAEMIAKKLDLSVTYLKINKVRRGYYEAKFITLADNAKVLDDYQITDMFLKELEKQIYQAPEYYLWTHKRWKHRDNVPKQFQ